MRKTFFSSRHSDSEARLLCFAKKKNNESVPDASNPENTRKKSKAEIRNEEIAQLRKENAELKEKLKTVDDLKKEVETLKQQTKQISAAPFAPYNTPGNGTLLPGQQLKGPYAAVPGAIDAANQARINVGYPTAADPRRIYARQHRVVSNVPVEQPLEIPLVSPAPINRPRSYYDPERKLMIHDDGKGNVRAETLDQLRDRLDAERAQAAYVNNMQRNQSIANGRLVANWRSNPLGVEHQLNTERTARGLGITPDQMYNPVTGTEAAFNEHVRRASKNNPVLRNKSGNYAYVDSDIPVNQFDSKLGMNVDKRKMKNEYLASNDPRLVYGMPGAEIMSDGIPVQADNINTARGIYEKRAKRTPAGNVTPFNKIDTNTTESQKEITDFYQDENIRRLQSGEFDDLKNHENPAVRKAYADITSAFSDGNMKRKEVTYGDTALARTRMENLRRNAAMMSNNESISGNKLAERFYPVFGFAGDAPVRIEYEGVHRGRKEKRNISIHDPRMWGDGIYGAKGSEDYAKDAGIRVVQDTFSNGKVKGLALEFTKPGKFTVISHGPNGKAQTEVVTVKNSAAPYEEAPSVQPKDVPAQPAEPLPPAPVPSPRGPSSRPNGPIAKPTPKSVVDDSKVKTSESPVKSESATAKTAPVVEEPLQTPFTVTEPTPSPAEKKSMNAKSEALKQKFEPGEEDIAGGFDMSEESTVTPEKKKGFFGSLQGIFSGGKEESKKAPEAQAEEVSTGGGFELVEDLSAPVPEVKPAVTEKKTITRRRGRSTSEKPADALDALKHQSAEEAQKEEPADALSAIPEVPADALSVISAAPELTPEQKQMVLEGSDTSAYEDFLVDRWNNSEATLKPLLNTLLEQSRKTTQSPSAAEKHADAASERALLRQHADVWLDSNAKYIFIGRVQFLNTLINEQQTPKEIEKEFRDYIAS